MGVGGVKPSATTSLWSCLSGYCILYITYQDLTSRKIIVTSKPSPCKQTQK